MRLQLPSYPVLDLVSLLPDTLNFFVVNAPLDRKLCVILLQALQRERGRSSLICCLPLRPPELLLSVDALLVYSL